MCVCVCVCLCVYVNMCVRERERERVSGVSTAPSNIRLNSSVVSFHITGNGDFRKAAVFSPTFDDSRKKCRFVCSEVALQREHVEHKVKKRPQSLPVSISFSLSTVKSL